MKPRVLSALILILLTVNSSVLGKEGMLLKFYLFFLLLVRKFGLDPEQKDFLFKLLQSLLPTQERLARIGKKPSPACSFCDAQVDNNAHLLTCPQGAEITAPLTRFLQGHVEDVTPQLTLPTTDSMELPVAWLVSSCLMVVWNDRVRGKISRLTTCQAKLEARLLVLKHTRWKHYNLHNSAVLLEEILSLHFR